MATSKTTEDKPARKPQGPRNHFLFFACDDNGDISLDNAGNPVLATDGNGTTLVTRSAYTAVEWQDEYPDTKRIRFKL